MATPTNGAGVDTETIIQLLNTLMSQSRSINNNLGLLIKHTSDLGKDVGAFVKIQTLTRDRRFEEEITSLETQIEVLRKQLEDKRTLKADIRSTSDKIKAVTKEQIDAEAKKNQIDWRATKQVMVNAAAGAVAIAIVWGIVTRLPEIAIWLQNFLGR